MKRSLLIFCAAIISLGNLFAFEGVVTVNYVSEETGNLPMEMKWYMDGEKLLVEILTEVEGEQETLFILPNLGSGMLYMYNENPAENGKNFYTEVPVSGIEGGADIAFNAQKTGRTNEVAGMNCQHITANGEGLDVNMWYAPEIDFPLFKYADFFKTNYELPVLKALNINVFPMEARTEDAYGDPVSAFKVIAVEEGEVEDSLFSLPAGYVESSKVFEKEE